LRNLESFGAPLALQDVQLVMQDAAHEYACDTLVSAARVGGPVVTVVRRGRCSFAQKA